MAARQPTGLTVDLLSASYAPTVRTNRPRFSWIVNANHNNAMQQGYRILVSSTADLASGHIGDLWDSGSPDIGGAWSTNPSSTAIEYVGADLSPDTEYFWQVMVWLGPTDASPWSETVRFHTATELAEYAVSHYEPQVSEVAPVAFIPVSDTEVFVDFGRAAFGTLRLTLSSPDERSIVVHLGEVADASGRIDRNPGGSRRYLAVNLPASAGTQTYTVEIPQNERNTGPLAIKVADGSPEVVPFRYCEIEGAPPGFSRSDITQLVLHQPFDQTAAAFTSSLPVLNDVWELCHHSMKATSFLGIYVDGDRERIPYEADAYINGLGHFGCDREYSMCRRTIDHLIDQPTWPTEWQLYLVIAAWTEYLFSGDSRLIIQRYDDLVAKAMMPLRNSDGLLDTDDIPQDVLEAIHFTGESAELFTSGVRDVIDWPQCERDNYELTPVNSVVSALHHRTLICLEKMAEALGKPEDRDRFRTAADETRASFRRLLISPITGLVIDGIGSKHSSLHANMFALACDVLDPEDVPAVRRYVQSRGMACSVYGSQILLEAMFGRSREGHVAAGDGGEYGLALLTSQGLRSWAHMVYDVGTTISMEAWDDSIKPNQDWNHAWGAAPASIIPFWMMGVWPLEPGFSRVLIDPKPGTMSWAECRVPTIRGDILVRTWASADGHFSMETTIPANTLATIGIPGTGDGTSVIHHNGQKVVARSDSGRLYLDDIGGGIHRLSNR